MRKFNLELPKYRLALQFRLIKRRKPLVVEPLIPTIKAVNEKYKNGTSLSKFFRHIFEHKKINRALASVLSILVIGASYFPPGSTAQAQESVDETTIEPSINLTTDKSVQFPVSPVKVTQKFSSYHPGVDFDGLTGDPVKSIKPGRVSAVSYSRFAYGNSIIIEHTNSISSLYAHLSKIQVVAGQEVTMDTEIGKMGSSGRASGDHLHLEIHDHGKSINPLVVLR